MERIPEALLDRQAGGVNLVPGLLRDQLGPEPQLLVFLRHFGCMFCRETVADLRHCVDKEPEFPAVLFFAQATATESRAFLRRYWPAARVVADPELAFYEGFGLGRGGLLQTLGPKVLLASRRARAKGHENGPRAGDIWRMPGVFAVAGANIVWSYAPRHAADHPDFAAIPQLLAAAIA